MIRFLPALAGCLASLLALTAGCDPGTFRCGAGEVALDEDGDEVLKTCVAIQEGGTEGEACAFTAPCADGLFCFCEECGGSACEYDDGVCQVEQV